MNVSDTKLSLVGKISQLVAVEQSVLVLICADSIASLEGCDQIMSVLQNVSKLTSRGK